MTLGRWRWNGRVILGLVASAKVDHSSTATKPISVARSRVGEESAVLDM